LVREEEGRLLNTCYPPDEVCVMLVAAGLGEVRVEGPHTGRPPDPSDDTVVVMARRVS
jgi:hypothetical protein